MLKKLFPTKDKDEVRHQQAIAKIVFLLVVALSIVAALFLVDPKKTPQESSAEEAKTLGEQTIEQAQEQDKALAKNIEEGVSKVHDTAEFLRTELETTTESVVEEGKKQVEDTANSIIYNATLKPIVDKIETLPPAQQNQLRKQICPIVDNE